MLVLSFIPVFLASLASYILGTSAAHGQDHFQSSAVSVPKVLAVKWSYTDCGQESDAIRLELLTMSPDPPVPGKNLTITVKGLARKTIKEGAYADVVVKMGLIKLLTRRFDICEEARNANVSVTCPVAKGMHRVVHTVALPWEIPPAKFKAEVRAYTVDDEDMLCSIFDVDFR
ncbi:ML domain-containing protein [Mycena crocata]|nr:ML domain-containing protein [Mycena crocata]